MKLPKLESWRAWDGGYSFTPARGGTISISRDPGQRRRGMPWRVVSNGLLGPGFQTIGEAQGLAKAWKLAQAAVADLPDAPLPVALKVHPSLDSIIGGGASVPPDSHFQREWARVGPSVRKQIMRDAGLSEVYAENKYYERLPSQPRTAFTTWLSWEASGSVSTDKPSGSGETKAARAARVDTARRLWQEHYFTMGTDPLAALIAGETGFDESEVLALLSRFEAAKGSGAHEVAAVSGPGCLAGGGVDSPPAPPGFDLKAGIKKAFRTAPGVAWLIGADNSGHWRAWRVDDSTGALQWNGPGRTGRMVAELDALADHQAYKAPAAQGAIDFSRAAELTEPEALPVKGGKQMKMIVHATCPATGAGALRKGATMKRKGKGKRGKVKASGALPEVRDDVERMIDKYRILHVLEAIQEVADEKADFIIETWQDQHGARVWKQVARKVAAAGKAIARLRAIGL